MKESFLRLIVTGLLTTFSVAITSLYVGMNRDVRHNLLNLITNKIRK